MLFCLWTKHRECWYVLDNIQFIFYADFSFGQDQGSKITAVKTAQKFFSEDKDRSFEAKVCHLVNPGMVSD